MSLQRFARFVPVMVLAAFLLLLVATYAGGDVQGYYRLLRYTGMRPYYTPFLDTDTVMSAARCLHNGIDAYKVNPCDPLWRPYDYSPIYMGLAWFPVTQAWLVPMGIFLNVLFLCALLLLPMPRERAGAVMMSFGALSTTSLFALERGNNELLIFSLAALGAWGLSRRKVWGYGPVLLAGLLKYFPLLAMASALRERPSRLFALAALSILIVGGFVGLTWHEFTRSLANYPWLSPYSETFGAMNAAEGTARIFRWSKATRLMLFGLSIALCLALALRLASRAETGKALERLDFRQQSFLLVGGLLTVGCYFASRNIDYRGIHLLMALPALIALRAEGLSGWIRSAALFVVLLLWGGFLRMHLTFAGRAVGGNAGWYIDWWLGWFGRELLWWWVITVLIALTSRLLWQGPLVSDVLARFKRA